MTSCNNTGIIISKIKLEITKVREITRATQTLGILLQTLWVPLSAWNGSLVAGGQRVGGNDRQEIV